MDIKSVGIVFRYKMSNYILKKWETEDWDRFRELLLMGKAEKICGPDIDGDWIIYFPIEMKINEGINYIKKCVRNTRNKGCHGAAEV